MFEGMKKEKVITLNIPESAVKDITEALKLGMNYGYQHVPEGQRQIMLNAGYYWRVAQPDYDPLEGFRRECEKWGCD